MIFKKPSSEYLWELHEDRTFSHIFRVICAHGDKTMFEYSGNGTLVKVSYREFAQACKRAAYRLSSLLGEQRRGCYVGLQMDNCLEWPYLFWGLLMAGYNPVLLDFRAPADVLIHVLAESGAIALVSDQPTATAVTSAILLRKEEITQWQGELAADWQPHWAEHLALCTSGTTATSKVFVYHEAAFAVNLASGWEAADNTPCLISDTSEVKLLAFLPFYHIYGLALYCWYTLTGKTFVFLKDRAPATILQACQQHGVTNFMSVPLVWNNLAAKITAQVNQLPRWQRVLFKTLCNLSLGLQYLAPTWGRRFAYRHLFHKVHAKMLGPKIEGLMSGGAYLSPKVIRLLTALGMPLLNGYGMTETGIISLPTGERMSEILTASLGKPLSSLEVKLVPIVGHADQRLGEVYVRGESLHTGRLQKGQLLPPVRDEQGWFATGDLGRIDRRGKLTLLGRCKDTIVSATGEKVYPDELEDIFRSLEGIEEFCVVGIRNEVHDEDIVIVTRIKSDQNHDVGKAKLAQQVDKINRSLPIYKRVTRLLLSATPLPTTSSMKTQRVKLKQLIESKNWDSQALPLHVKTAITEPVTAKATMESKPGDLTLQVQAAVRQMFAKVLHKPMSAISDDAHFIADLGGDSLEAIQLGTELENHFHVFISDSILLQCTNVKEISAAVLEQLTSNLSVSQGGNIKAVKPPTTRKPIVNIEESHEYQMFTARMSQAGDFNPYFIPHDSVIKDTSFVHGKEMINFASYNYLGFSGHPETMKAAQLAIEKYGTSASGSRLITGEKPLYRDLEQRLAKWKHVDDSIVLVSGHATNVTLVGNFCNENDLILYDALSHNSIEQGCRLSRSDSKAFPHNDFVALDQILATRRPFYEKVLLVVEGVYSMDGDIAPIPEFVKLKNKYGCFLMVDEAHSTGVLGKTGRGVDEYFDLEPEDIDIRMGTLSKGFGSCGGYLAGNKKLIDYFHYSLPGFVFSVGIPPASAAVALKAIEILERDHSMVTRLHENIDIFLEEAHQRNFHTCLAQQTAILPILVGDDKAAFVLSHSLRQKGIFVTPAIYPAVPKGQARLRFCVTSEHKKNQIVYGLDTLQQIAAEHGIQMPAYQAKIASA